MLYRVLKSVINNGIKNNTLDKVDMQNKLDVFYAKGRITTAQYEELSTLVDSYIPPEETTAEE